MLETLCGATSPVPTTKGLAQPSPHLFPVESNQRSAQISKVLIPQTPKNPGVVTAPQPHPFPAMHHFRTFFNTTSCTPGEARGLFFTPNHLKKNSKDSRGAADAGRSSLHHHHWCKRGWIQPWVCSEPLSTCQSHRIP